MLWLITGAKVGFETFIFFFLEADEGATQSFDSDFPGILIECEVHEYRRRIIDANVKEILPRVVAQEAMVPTNSFHGV